MVLLDDDPSGREGIASLLRAQPEFRVLAASADLEEALLKVREADPDVVLLKLGSRGSASWALVAAIRRESPRSRLIVLGMRPRLEDVMSLVRAGVSGFIMADADFDRFLLAIRIVARGAPYLPAELAHTLFGQLARRRSIRPSLQNPSMDGWVLTAGWGSVPA
jgi:DNA-binding NarL/FixJ family response regulator